MKGALRVAAAAVLCASGFDSAGALFFRNTEDAVGAQEKIASFAVEDFVLPLGGPDPDPGNAVNGVQVRAALFQTLPALEGQGLTMTVFNVEACAANPPHIHPRAAEIIYMLEGDLRVGFTEENGGTRAIINDISQGDVTLFPQGLVHYQQNLGCSPATFVAALNSEDPGTSVITTNLFNLPIEAIKAVLPVDDTDLEAIITALPTVLTTSRQECLEECGLTPGGDEVCSNGLPGVQFEDACCSLSCGTCGGLGCGQRDGGRDECCVGIIRDNGLLCSESNSSPCIVDDGLPHRLLPLSIVAPYNTHPTLLVYTSTAFFHIDPTWPLTPVPLVSAIQRETAQVPTWPLTPVPRVPAIQREIAQVLTWRLTPVPLEPAIQRETAQSMVELTRVWRRL